MEIKIVGPGCTNCKRLYAEAEKAIVQAGHVARLIKVEAIEEIARCGVMTTPALMIDGRVVASGRIPGAAEIATMIANAAARA